MTFLLLKTFLAVLGAVLLGGIAVNVSPIQSVLDGLLIMLLKLNSGFGRILRSPDFWEGMKALCGSLMLSGAIMYSLASGTDPSALTMDLTRGSTAVSVVVAFIGVAYSSRMQRRLLSQKP